METMHDDVKKPVTMDEKGMIENLWQQQLCYFLDFQGTDCSDGIILGCDIIIRFSQEHGSCIFRVNVSMVRAQLCYQPL